MNVINDIFGQTVGDTILTDMAKTLGKVLPLDENWKSSLMDLNDYKDYADA